MNLEEVVYGNAKARFEELGQIMVDSVGLEACELGYQTTDLAMIGRVAVQYGDIDFETGELN